jgi:two-component system response regulator PilR (NtrC family)
VDADIRIITATNRDLAAMVDEGRFRQDLYYRINVINVHLPPLRDRREDIPLLAEHFAQKYGRQMGKQISGISGEAMGLLRRYRWPGNIRELENAIERAVALERTSVIMPESLSLAHGRLPDRPVPPSEPAEGRGDRLPSGFDLEQHVQEIEREYIAEALRRAGGVKVRAAELLGMSFRSFRYYTKKYNLK